MVLSDRSLVSDNAVCKGYSSLYLVNSLGISAGEKMHFIDLKTFKFFIFCFPFFDE